jgi:hypothetical protein
MCSCTPIFVVQFLFVFVTNINSIVTNIVILIDVGG